MKKSLNFTETRFPELFERIEETKQLRSACSGRSVKFNPTLTKDQMLVKSSTTILAIRCKDCVILSGDRRTSDGLEIFSDETQKLHQVTKFSGVGFSGVCVSIQETIALVKNICRSFENSYYQELSLDGQANILSQLTKYYYWLSEQLFSEKYLYEVLAGFDVEERKPRIFLVCLDGYLVGRNEDLKFAGVGCGYPDIKVWLKDKWKKGLDVESGLEMIIEAMGQSGANSSGVSDFRISPPTVAIIDKDGFRWVEESKIKTIVKSIIKNEKWRSL